MHTTTFAVKIQSWEALSMHRVLNDLSMSYENSATFRIRSIKTHKKLYMDKSEPFEILGFKNISLNEAVWSALWTLWLRASNYTILREI